MAARQEIVKSCAAKLEERNYVDDAVQASINSLSWSFVSMARACPQCGKELDAVAIRCSCGTELPEARDVLSDPDSPECSICHKGIDLNAEKCPHCGSRGYPALRPRQSKKSLGVGEDLIKP